MNIPFKKIATAIGALDIETKDGGSYFNNEQLAQIESVLPESATQEVVAQYEQQLSTQATQLETLTNEAATATQTIAALEAQVAELKKTPAASVTKVLVNENTDAPKGNLTAADLLEKWNA